MVCYKWSRLDTDPEPEPSCVKNRNQNRNRNFSKVRTKTGTVKKVMVPQRCRLKRKKKLMKIATT
jgi:hypothetical protein